MLLHGTWQEWKCHSLLGDFIKFKYEIGQSPNKAWIVFITMDWKLEKNPIAPMNTKVNI